MSKSSMYLQIYYVSSNIRIMYVQMYISLDVSIIICIYMSFMSVSSDVGMFHYLEMASFMITYQKTDWLEEARHG